MDKSTDKIAAWSRLFARIFDSSPAHVALLDLDGVIVQTNRAWRDYGRQNGLPADYDSVGRNYLKICEAGADRGNTGAKEAYVGLLEVLRTQRPKFTMVYPCHSPKQKRWFRMWVQPQLPQVPLIVVAHYPSKVSSSGKEMTPFEPEMVFPASQGWDANGAVG